MKLSMVLLVLVQACVIERTFAQLLEELVLTQEEIDSFVDLHNHFRRIRGSSNIRLMSWDQEIADIAETYSRGCTFAHSSSELRTTETFPQIGENLYSTSTSSSFRNRTKVLNSVKSWYDEVEDYNLEILTCAEGKACGHYTQVVWSQSYKLGCGATICQPSNSGLDHQIIVVCQYGPAGNFVREAPYTEGDSCSNCFDASDVCVTGLCANGNRGDVIPVQPSSTSSAPPTTSYEAPQTSSTSAATPPTSSETPQTSSTSAATPPTSSEAPQTSSTSAATPPTSSEVPQTSSTSAATPPTSSETPQTSSTSAATLPTSSETPQTSSTSAATPPTSSETPQTSSTSAATLSTSSESPKTSSTFSETPKTYPQQTTPYHTEEEKTTPVFTTPTQTPPISTPHTTFPPSTGCPSPTPITECGGEDLKDWRESYKQWKQHYNQYVEQYLDPNEGENNF